MKKKKPKKIVRRFKEGKPITSNRDLVKARSAIIPEHLIYATPLLTQWVEWVNARNPRRQPEIALGSALAGMSMIIGRNLTWQGRGANIYVLGLATSASGKDACKRGIQEVMEYVRCGERVGNGHFGDERAFYDDLAEKREMIALSDEFHIFMSNVDEGKNTKVTGPIVKMLLDAFSGDVAGITRRGRTMPDIIDPYLSLFALCQPTVFWNLCKMESIENGFLGRFIIINGRAMPPISIHNMAPPPEKLIDGLRSGFERETGKHEIEASQECIDYANKMSADFDRDFTQRAVHVENNPLKGSLYARTMEKANRLALIHAWSLCPSKPVMTTESIQWGFDFMTYCNKFTLAGINGKLHDLRRPMVEARIIMHLMKQGELGAYREDFAEAMSIIGVNSRVPLLIAMEEEGKIYSKIVMIPLSAHTNYKKKCLKYWLGKRTIGNELPSFINPTAAERNYYERQESTT